MGPATPKIDKVLAANLAKAKLAQADKPYFFALVLKGGGTSGKLLVDRLKIKEKPISDAKRATGGSAVVIGVCYWDRQLSKLVFETEKPALPTWAQLVKLLAKKEAGLSIEPKFILAKRKVAQIKEPEDDKDDGKGKPEEQSTEKKEGLEKWNERFEGLKAKLTAADKSGKPWAKALLLKLSEAGTAYRQGKEDQAKTMYKEVVEAAQKSTALPAGANGQPAAGGSRPQGGTAPAKGPIGPGAATGSRPASREGEDHTLAGMDKRLQRLLPAYRAAKASPNQAQLTKLWESADRFRTNGDFAKGMKELDEFEKLIAAGEGAAKTAPTSNQAASVSKPNGEAEWTKALAQIEPAYLQGVRSRPDHASKLRAVMGFAQGKAEKKDFPGALAALKSLKDLLAKVSATATAGQTTAAPSSGADPAANRTVKPNAQAALAQWTTARSKVIESLKALEGRIRTMNDPDGDDAIVLVKAIQANLTARPDTPKAVTELERYITTDPIIVDAEEPNGFGIEIAIRGTLLPALAGLRDALSA